MLAFVQQYLVESRESFVPPASFVKGFQARRDEAMLRFKARAGALGEYPVAEEGIIGYDSRMAAVYQAAVQQAEKPRGEQPVSRVLVFWPGAGKQSVRVG